MEVSPMLRMDNLAVSEGFLENDTTNEMRLRLDMS